MQVHVTPDLAVELLAPEDLKSFKLVAAVPATDRAKVEAALAGIARFDAEGHAWVRESWIREASPLAGDAAWQQGVTGMIGYARKFGWVDDEAATIRAHVEWAA